VILTLPLLHPATLFTTAPANFPSPPPFHKPRLQRIAQRHQRINVEPFSHYLIQIRTSHDRTCGHRSIGESEGYWGTMVGIFIEGMDWEESKDPVIGRSGRSGINRHTIFLVNRSAKEYNTF